MSDWTLFRITPPEPLEPQVVIRRAGRFSWHVHVEHYWWHIGGDVCLTRRGAKREGRRMLRRYLRELAYQRETLTLTDNGIDPADYGIVEENGGRGT